MLPSLRRGYLRKTKRAKAVVGGYVYTKEHIQNITTKRIASFDGLILDTNDIYALRRDGKWYGDLCGSVAIQNLWGANSDISGHLMHSPLYDEFAVALVKHFEFPHALPVSSGDKANDFALELVYARHHPPDDAPIVVFQRAFHGRSSTMKALNGGPPTPLSPRANVIAIPFYSPEAPHAAYDALKKLVTKRTRPSCFMAELFQGEGGFHYAPPEFFFLLFSLCREYGVPIIVDEVHTCCRTGYPLLLDRYNLRHFPDIVTVGKATQTAAVLFTDGYDADKAELSETNPGGSATQLASGIYTLNTLAKEGYWGKNGKIMQSEENMCLHFQNIKNRHPQVNFVVLGNMAAIHLPCFTTRDHAQVFVDRLLKEQLLTTTCGRGNTYKVRMYFPLITTGGQRRLIFAAIEKIVRSFGPLGKGV